MNSRERMVETTLRLLRTQGLRATGMNQIVQESQAPRGSIYHHFPGGKEQLAAEALRAAGAAVAAKIRAVLDAHKDVTVALRKYIEAYAEEIRESDYQRGCPVGNAATDATATSANLREVCAGIFEEWEQLIARSLERDGFRPKEARGLAEFILSSLEGALILVRVRRSTDPLKRVAEQITASLAAAKRHRRPRQ
ncbi:MAG: TetR/AcrR family transcriptional regulator [Candidatus Rokuibacteriota bacterium]